MPVGLIIALIFILLALTIVFFIIYNKLLYLNKIINDAWVEIDYQMKQRAELIPSLIEFLRKNAKNEKDLINIFLLSNKKIQDIRSISGTIIADKIFTEGFSRLIVLSETNKNLKSNDSFQELVFRLLDIEEKIQTARRAYSSYAEELNAKLETFPFNIINSLAGHFEPRKIYNLKEKGRR